MSKMSWAKLLSTKRLGEPNKAPSNIDGRSAFDADIQRIIFSGAFRRLSRKTQVHPLAANDHVHTRLTHSLEVAQVGKTLGKALGHRIKDHLPDGINPEDIGSIVEAACLAHDLGNPPFGHAGEEAMSHWFKTNGPIIFRSLHRAYKKDLMFFEGNAQGFRMITQTEHNLVQGGLDLSCATLGAFLKYPWNSKVQAKKDKFGAFLTEEKILSQVANELGLVELEKDKKWARHPLAFLVEAADDICYGIVDLVDAVELKILSYNDVEEKILQSFSIDERAEIKSSLDSGKKSNRAKLRKLTKQIFKKTIAGAIDGFMNAYEEIMKGEYQDKDLFSALNDDDERKEVIKNAKELARDSIFSDPRKVEIELGSYAVFETLLNSFCMAAIEQSQCLNSPSNEVSLGWKSQLVMKMLGEHAPGEDNYLFQDKFNSLSQKEAHSPYKWSEYQCLRRVIDFISGMTDNYAVYIANQLQGAGFSGGQRP